MFRLSEPSVGNVSLRRQKRSFSLPTMSLLRCSVLLICLALAGCHRSSPGVMDEEKEPYFLAAKKRIQERDPQGAIEYFEKALDVNPRSASAHAELGMLYEKQDAADFAAALYHYKRAVDIRPDLQSAELIKARMEDCKRELAKSVVQLPTMEMLQRKIDALTIENQNLRTQLQSAFQGYGAGRTTNFSPQPVAPVPSNPVSRVNPPANTVRNDVVPTIRGNPVVQPGRPSGRAHVVMSGETLGAIARRYNVRLPALQSANPTVDARRLRPGQVLVIPSAPQ